MKNFRRFTLIARYSLLITFVASSAFAGGSAPFAFLRLPASARTAALSGAVVALPDEISALSVNPAVLGTLKTNQATFMHNEFFEDVNQESFAVGSKKGLGLSINFVNLGDFDQTTLTNPNGTGLSQFDGEDLAITAGVGRSVMGLSVGVSGKFIRESLGGETAQAIAADLGALYQFPEMMPLLQGLSLGLAIQNIGGKTKFSNQEEGLPLTIRAGLAKTRQFTPMVSLTTLLDLEKPSKEDWEVRLGMEAQALQMVFGRIGWSTRNDAGSGVTGGVGFQIKTFRLDYAFAPFGPLGDAHRFSVAVKF